MLNTGALLAAKNLDMTAGSLGITQNAGSIVVTGTLSAANGSKGTVLLTGGGNSVAVLGGIDASDQAKTDRLNACLSFYGAWCERMRSCNGQPDVWEQYKDGALIAILYDDDFDGKVDRRERRLHVTDQGRALAHRLLALQTKRLATALDEAGADGDAAEAFLFGVISSGERPEVKRLVRARSPKASKTGSPHEG